MSSAKIDISRSFKKKISTGDITNDCYHDNNYKKLLDENIRLSMINDLVVKELMSYKNIRKDKDNDECITCLKLRRELDIVTAAHTEMSEIVSKLKKECEILDKRRASTNASSKDYYKRNREVRLQKQKNYILQKKQQLSELHTDECMCTQCN